MFNFQKCEIIRSFGNSIFNDKTTLGEANKKQNNLLESILEFKDRGRPRTKQTRREKLILLKDI